MSRQTSDLRGMYDSGSIPKNEIEEEKKWSNENRKGTTNDKKKRNIKYFSPALNDIIWMVAIRHRMQKWHT